jgi:dolichol-phosphate mannosyltransferase
LEYERKERVQGQSGYTLKKLVQIAFDGIFAFSSFPIRVISFLGFTGLTIGFLYAIYILTLYFVYGISIQGFTTIVLLVIFFGSLNLISIGLAGEYIYRIFLETKKRPHAIIASTINI